MYRISVQGTVLQIKKHQIIANHGVEDKTGNRGKVTKFSKKSRKRLMELFNRFDYDGKRCVFVTLTFSSIPEHAFARKVFKRWLERMRYDYPNACAVWRKELQARGAIHFHMIWFDLPFIEQSDLQDGWTECTEEELSIVDIRLIHNRKMAIRYVSKYVAKNQEPEETASLEDVPYQQKEKEASTGRWWGYHNKMLLPYAVERAIVIPCNGAMIYLKFAMKVFAHFRCAVRTLSGMLFHEEANNLYDYFLEISQITDMNQPALLPHLRGIDFQEFEVRERYA